MQRATPFDRSLAASSFRAGSIRSLYRRLSDASEAYRRRRLVVPVGQGSTSEPTVYFLTPDFARPAGGNRVIYRHVDILNDAGIPAIVLHQRRGFQYTWFSHRTRIADVESVTIRGGDLLVLPEVDVDLLDRVPAGTRHVIFNQNSHLTWQRNNGTTMRTRVGNPDLGGILTVSEHNRQMLQFAFPGVGIDRMHVAIDPQLFRRGPDERRKRIGYMPRRGRDDAWQVIELLRGRGVLEGWDVVALDGLTHEEVADQLRTTRIFLAFTHQEGFGLPAAEAMACGNYVIGNAGFGGREFFRPEFSKSIESGDVLSFARAVDLALVEEQRSPGWCVAQGRMASDHVLGTYSLERERAEITAFYRRVLHSDHRAAASRVPA